MSFIPKNREEGFPALYLCILCGGTFTLSNESNKEKGFVVIFSPKCPHCGKRKTIKLPSPIR